MLDSVKPSVATLDRPIFIVGPGRSGTTLLRSLLSAHSRIAVTPETHFMKMAEAWQRRHGEASDLEAFWEAYGNSVRFRDLGVSALRCRALIEQQGGYSVEAIFRAMLAAYLERAEKARIGEKTPSHCRYLGTLLEWFPDARVLYTQRDPRAVVASQMHTWYTAANLTPFSWREGLAVGSRAREIAFYARDWARIYAVHLAPWRHDPRVRRVVYEDLVQHPARELEAICSFLEEPFEPSMLAERSSRSVPDAAATLGDRAVDQWRAAHHARSRGSISADSAEKWREELSPAELAVVEGCCAPAMRAFGYAPVTPPAVRLRGRLRAGAVEMAAAAEGGVRTAYRRRGRMRRRLQERTLGPLLQRSVERGVPPGWYGYRWVPPEGVRDYVARTAAIRVEARVEGTSDPRTRNARTHVAQTPDAPAHDAQARYETVHAERIFANPLPRNVGRREELPAAASNWGFSFRDVPERRAGETFIATLPEALVATYRDPKKADDFYPAIVSRDGRGLSLREVRFMPGHGEVLRRAPPPLRMERATWIAERVYHNYAHWLTAHLPKLLLLRERDMLADIVLPPERSAAIDASLRMIGIAPEEYRTFDETRPLSVGELTVVGSDRFRPELLRLVPKAFGSDDAPPPDRRVLVSRASAARRRLVNEDEVWALLEPEGFERVEMERLSFEEQVALMRETRVLLAPHGAGLANMVFCPRGADIVELANMSAPSPNFYALASGLEHRYWLLRAEGLGRDRDLHQDLRMDIGELRALLPQLLTAAPASAG